MQLEAHKLREPMQDSFEPILNPKSADMTDNIFE